MNHHGANCLRQLDASVGNQKSGISQIMDFIVDGYTNVAGVNIHQNWRLFCQSLLVYELPALAVPI